MMLDSRSLERLRGVHPDLVKVVHRASEITKTPFVVIEGLRTPARQKKLVASGASRTLKSRHIHGFAVDLAPYVDDGDGNAWDSIRWDWPLFYPMAAAVKQAAKELNVPVQWGGDWRTFKDGPHFELSSKFYKDPK